MRYCLRCVYPENARPAIYIDEQGVCSGCRSFEARTIARATMLWGQLERDLGELLRDYAARQFAKGNPYDCIIPVSGGKDSHYQVWMVRERFGLNPLLVCFNHAMNTPLGVRNLTNLVEKTGCHLIRYTLSPSVAIRLAVEMLKRIGDVTWHYHAGIMTFPVQTAVAYDVPLIVWGEEGFSELVGMHQPEDMVEFTRKKRMEHSMRGIEPEMLLAEKPAKFTRYELAPFFYPSDEAIERVGVRGIYLSNYVPWDARGQAEFAIDRMGFETAQVRERTFNLYAKTDCIHANGLHDYLKFLKFGYGRATDDASNEIRHGRMTREEGIDMVMKYDHVRPNDIAVFLHTARMSPTEFDAIIGEYPGHDDNVGNHRNDPGVEQARVPPLTRAPFVRTPARQSARNEYPQQRYVTL